MDTAQEQQEEAKDEGAVGRVVLMVVKHPKAVVAFLGAIVAGLSGFTVWRESSRPVAEPAAVILRMDKKLTTIGDDVVKVKLTNEAILQTMPVEQRREARRIIELQLAAIRAARESQQ